LARLNKYLQLPLATSAPNTSACERSFSSSIASEDLLFIELLLEFFFVEFLFVEVFFVELSLIVESLSSLSSLFLLLLLGNKPFTSLFIALFNGLFVALLVDTLTVVFFFVVVGGGFLAVLLVVFFVFCVKFRLILDRAIDTFFFFGCRRGVDFFLEGVVFFFSIGVDCVLSLSAVRATAAAFSLSPSSPFASYSAIKVEQLR